MGEQCHFYILKLPPTAVEKDILYRKQNLKVPSSAYEPWFTRNVLGQNTLDKLLENMLQDAGIEYTNKSNHSLQATAITKMMEKNVPSRVIMQRYGHLSKDGLVPYERTTSLQQQSLCKALGGVTLEKANQVQHVSGNTLQKYCTKEKQKENVPEPVEVLKCMNFQDMEGCTIKTNYHLN